MYDPSDPPLRISLFGPLEIHLPGGPLPRLRTRKGQWLLALFVLRAGQELERDWLAGTLWPQSPSAMALTNLRGSLADLRRALGAEGTRLRSPARNILTFDLTGVQADVLAFDAAMDRDEPAAFREAISLYRGPLLEQCAAEWVFPERQLREQAYLRALERLAADARAGGDLALAETYLRRAAAADPHRESAQRALMQVLAERGHFAAAAQTYRDLRLRLHRELNVAPDPQTQQLFEQIRATANGADVARPASPRRSRLPSRRGNLPAPPTVLLGRDRELAAIAAALRGEATDGC